MEDFIFRWLLQRTAFRRCYSVSLINPLELFLMLQELAILVSANMNAVPGEEAILANLAKNLMLKSQFRVKLDCRAFQTLG